MAHMSPAQISARRQEATLSILSMWETMKGAVSYALQCPCEIDCWCMPHDEVPRIILNKCMYVGKLEYFVVQQPFLDQQGFRLSCFCDDCHSEMACGIIVKKNIKNCINQLCIMCLYHKTLSINFV